MRPTAEHEIAPRNRPPRFYGPTTISPCGRWAFRSLAPGEPFFFKTKAPQNRIVGGGFFSDFARLPLSEAWDLFGEANGAASPAELRLRIDANRSELIRVGDDPVIGCILVRDVRFFAIGEEADPPQDFARTSCREEPMTLRPTRKAAISIEWSLAFSDARSRWMTHNMAAPRACVRRPAPVASST